MSVLIELFKGLQTELQTALAKTVDRRYMPRRNIEDLDVLRISIYIEATEREELGRQVDVERYTYGIAVQKAAGPSVEFDSDGQPVVDGVDNIAFGDEVLNQMEAVKDLFRKDGALRFKVIAGCTFQEMVHEPPYEPLHLLTMGIYTSILDITYQL